MNSASTSAVNAVPAMAWCSTDRLSRSRSGEIDSATNSSPMSAPATVAEPLKKGS
jgi:hypothetical protein